MTKKIIKVLMVTTFFCFTGINSTKVLASPQEDITVLNNKIDILENQLSKVVSEIDKQNNSVSKKKEDINKKEKIISNVNNVLDKTEERQKESIKDLANKLTTNLIENKTKSLLTGEKETSEITSHPVGFSLLENKDNSIPNVNLENEILKETSKIIKKEKDELIQTKEVIESENKELVKQKKQIESDISTFRQEISKIQTEIKEANLREEILQRYGVYVSSNMDIVETALQYLGTPYIWGGTTPNGFDCSGFVRYVYAQHGVYLSRTTYTQIYDGTQVSVSDLQPGDLIFPNGDHVGMYIGNGKMVHAPQPGDVVKISNIGSVWKAIRVK